MYSKCLLIGKRDRETERESREKKKRKECAGDAKIKINYALSIIDFECYKRNEENY